jgi:hypothetical protein
LTDSLSAIDAAVRPGHIGNKTEPKARVRRRPGFGFCAYRVREFTVLASMAYISVPFGGPIPETGLKRDDFRMNRHRALGCCLGMIFSENCSALFQIMP